MKRLSVFLMAAALGVSSLSCPASVFARNPVVQNGVGADNFTIKTTFSDGLDAGSLDVYRIFFRLLDEDSRMGHIDVDANDTKLSARVVPGDYQVIRIKYIGSSKELKKEPAATKTFFRVYNDQVTTVPLAIGQEAVDKLTDKIGVGELYKEVDVNSTIEDTSNENDVTLNSPYVDKGVFDDDTVREPYLQDLTNNGYLDADGNLTDSGKRIQDALEQKGMKYETARQEAILNGMSLEEYLGLTDKDSKESKRVKGKTALREAPRQKHPQAMQRKPGLTRKAISLRKRQQKTVLSAVWCLSVFLEFLRSGYLSTSKKDTRFFLILVYNKDRQCIRDTLLSYTCQFPDVCFGG